MNRWCVQGTLRSCVLIPPHTQCHHSIPNHSTSRCPPFHADPRVHSCSHWSRTACTQQTGLHSFNPRLRLIQAALVSSWSKASTIGYNSRMAMSTH